MKKAVDLLEKGVEAGVFPGAQLVVVDGGQKVLDVFAGKKSLGGAPVAATTLFDVASLTKPLVTALLALRLSEEGRLRCSAEPLPGVTVRHLLSHSSGLPAWKPLFETAHGRETIVAAAAATPLERSRGNVSVYSDLGFIVLGDFIERTAGARLDALARAHIFADTTARFVDLAAADRPTDVASTENVPPGEVHDENCHAAGGILGHAGLFATARDVAAIVGTLVADWSADRGHIRTLWSPSGVPGSTWRLGWDGPAAEGSSAGTHWPKTGVGHLGFTGTSIWVDPPRRRFVILLTNRVHPTRANEAIRAFRPKIHDAIWEELGD